jgi:hypothetical protein
MLLTNLTNMLRPSDIGYSCPTSLWQKTATVASTSRLSQWVALTRYTQLHSPAKRPPAFTTSACRPDSQPHTFSTFPSMSASNAEAASRQDAAGSTAAVPVSAPTVIPQEASDLVATSSPTAAAVRPPGGANGVSGGTSGGFGRDLAKALKAVVKVFTTSSWYAEEEGPGRLTHLVSSFVMKRYRS